MKDDGNPGRPPAPRHDRAERLAAALRANLKRRKAQVRGRADRADSAIDEAGRRNQPDSDKRDW
jgi:hypothetical protein